MKKITKQLLSQLLPIFLVTSSLSFGQSLAKYTITFTGVWNATDHSEGGTTFPSTDHWSDLVGATHNSSITFWEAGQMATLGIEDVAERGDNDEIFNEVDAAIIAGTANQWLQQSVDPFDALGSATLSSITVSEDFPLLTLITMIAPSPDWFAGIHDVSLINNGNWESSITLDLFPYDAGTEDGTTYSTSNASTNPQQNISNLTNVNPFNNQKIGTLTITLDEVLNVVSNDFKTGISLSPNPASENLTITNATSEYISNIQIYDVIGKLVKTENVQSPKNNITLSLQNLNSGIYLVHINSKEGSSSHKKLIIK